MGIANITREKGDMEREDREMYEKNKISDYRANVGLLKPFKIKDEAYNGWKEQGP